MNSLQCMKTLMETSTFIDMTHPIEEGMPYWQTQEAFTAEIGEHQSKGDPDYWRKVSMSEHTGTHIDALSHFIEGSKNVDEIPVERIMGRAVNIDVTDTPACGLVSVQKIRDFEEAHGLILEGDLVFFRFGWDVKWGIGEDAADFLKDWPGISGEAAVYLVEKKVHAVGTDALAIDPFADTASAAHLELLGNGVNIIENIDKLGELPAFFAVIGLPCRFKGGSGSPIRLIAMLDR